MTKNRIVICGAVIGMVMLAANVLSVAGTAASSERVVATLADGSHISGELAVTTLPLESALVGKVQFPVNQIFRLTFQDDHQTATILLRNGDHFEARVGLTAFNLVTVVGAVNVPRKSLVELRFVTNEASAVTDGLVVHFALDDNDHLAVRDRSPSGLKGSVDGARPHAGAYQFNGQGDSIAVGFDKSFGFAAKDPFTLAAWVQPAPRPGEFQAIVVAAAPNAGFEWEWGLYVDQENHFMSGWERNAVIQSKTMVKADQWYHVAVTYEEGRWVLYVDGVPEAHVTARRELPTRGGLAIGRKGESTPPDFFEGLIRDVRIYKRALSAEEIARLDKATAVGVKPTP